MRLSAIQAKLSACCQVIYLDDHVVVVDKYAGILCQSDGCRDLKWMLEQALDRPVYVVHRLDAATSGVVIFALTSTVAAILNQAFAERTVTKRYVLLALRHQPWPANFEVRRAIENRQGQPILSDRGKKAHTRFVVEKAWPALSQKLHYALLFAEPITGRTHQIRLHIEAEGGWIVGDVQHNSAKLRHYRGAQVVLKRRLYLHAESLTLSHPVTGTPLLLEGKRPTAFSQLAAYLDRVTTKR